MCSSPCARASAHALATNAAAAPPVPANESSVVRLACASRRVAFGNSSPHAFENSSAPDAASSSLDLCFLVLAFLCGGTWYGWPSPSVFLVAFSALGAASWRADTAKGDTEDVTSTTKSA
eukprot:scaffold23062_cov55-Phaeocystis_antarctica.AAC.5